MCTWCNLETGKFPITVCKFSFGISKSCCTVEIPLALSVPKRSLFMHGNIHNAESCSNHRPCDDGNNNWDQTHQRNQMYNQITNKACANQPIVGRSILQLFIIQVIAIICLAKRKLQYRVRYLHNHLQKMHASDWTWKPPAVSTYIYHGLDDAYTLIQHRLQVSDIVADR